MQTKPYLQMSIAMLLIGSLFVASKVIVQYIPVMTASFWRQFLALITLALIMWVRQIERPPIARRDFWILATQGVVGIFVFSLCALYGLRLTSSLNANIITSTTPLTMMLIAVLMLGERFTKRGGLALLLAILGTLSINVLGGQQQQNGSNLIVGNLLVVMAVIAEGVFFGFSKLLSQPLPSTYLSLILTAIGSALFIPFALWEFPQISFSTTPWWVWLLVAYTGVGITAIGVVLMNMGMSQVSGSTASIFSALMPVSGILLSVLILKEPFQWVHALGMGLVFAGVGLVVTDQGKGHQDAEIRA